MSRCVNILIVGLLISLFTFGLGIFSTRIIPEFNEASSGTTPADVPPVLLDREKPLIAETEPEDEPFDVSYSPSPDGAYFPISDRLSQNDIALVLTFLDGGEKVAQVKEGDVFYSSDEIALNGLKLSFRTETHNSIRYEFDGRFLKNGFQVYFDDGDTVLTGTLKKYVKNTKVFQVQTRFIYDSEVCAWNPDNQ